MRKSLPAAAIALILAAGMPLSAVRAETPSLRDMPGHWAQYLVQRAAASGYVNGYPDGTFRPDSPVTRAEAVKLLTAAGKLHPNIQPGRQDIADLPPDHWLSAQGYSHAAVDYGLVVPATRWAPEDGYTFRPDQPATRLELLTWAVRLAGMPYSQPEEPTEPVPFADPIPKEAQRWVSAGRAMGLVEGYPDGTFRPDGPVTRAEAVVMAERALKWMTQGDSERLHLVVNGAEVTGAPVSVRNEWVYAPVNAIYGLAPDETAPVHQDTEVRVGNERFSYSQPVATVWAGNRVVTSFFQPSGGMKLYMENLPYVRLGEIMMPVAPVGGKGKIPYGEASHNTATETVSITYTADWPGYHLPTRPDQVRFAPSAPHYLAAQESLVIPVPNLEDAAGNAVKDAERQPVTYSVDPASPLRLRSNWDPDTYLTTYTAGPENNWQQPIVQVLPGAAKGTYVIKVEAPGYRAGEEPVVVQ